jgi:Integrase core domain
LLLPLPQCTEPNQRVHADLFGPLKNADGDKKFILCITDAFTKYVELVVLPNKEALTVATAILNRWICRHGLLLEFVTDQGKEFTNKMARLLFNALDVHHSTTASYHPQCNSQAEVCNKTIAQYLSTTVNEATTDWELFLPALAFAYNTSYHRSVKATPFSLTFGLEARLPAFFASDIDRLHDGSEASSHLERLRWARQLAAEHNLAATDKQKENFDVKATHHSYHVGQFVLLEDFNFLNKNRKLAPRFSGPFRILRVKGDHNVELLLTNGRKIVVNVARVKPYLRESLPSPSDVTVAAGDTPSTDTPPPPLTLAHSRRPRAILPEEKVLSPDPSVSFANLGAGSVGGTPPSSIETSVTRTHPMRTRSSTVTQNALSSRLSVILSRNFHCVLDNPKKKSQKVSLQLSPRKPRIGRSSRGGTPYGDPYKYSDYPQTGHSIDPPQPGIFNNLVGDNYFDDDNEDDEQGFRFEDLVPILEEDSDEYDL